MQFEWDLAKAEANLEKHGIDFIDVTRVFDDTARIILDVSRPDDLETRIKVIGKIRDVVIVSVVYTDRAGKIRIISARKASKDERERYNCNR
jgi:uncharacterized DUF497 family protein